MTSMASRPWPPVRKSLAPRPRTSSAPSSPPSLSGLSVPESMPPLGQPGRSFVVRTPAPMVGFLKVRVPSHRASSEAVAWGECVCSFCGASEPTPAQPTPRRSTAHPIREALTKAMRCPRRTTTHPPPLMCPLLLAPRSMPHYGVRRISQEGLFTQPRRRGVLRSSSVRRSKKVARRGLSHPRLGRCCSRCLGGRSLQDAPGYPSSSYHQQRASQGLGPPDLHPRGDQQPRW